MVMLVAVDQRWLDGGQWLWSPVSTTIFSSSSPCRGASLWFPSLFASVSSFFVGSRVFSAASNVLPSLPLLRGGTGGEMAFFPFLLCVFSSTLFSPASLSSFCFSRWCCRRGRQWQLVVMMKCSVPGVPPCCCSFFFSSLLSARFFPSVFFLCFFVSSPLFCPFPPPSSRCLSQRSWFLFIEPRAWLFTVLMGSSRLVGH